MSARRALLLALAASAIAAGPPKPAPLYDAPAPGSYELPVIRSVAEHTLLGSDGKPAPLLGLGPRECGVVSFIYRSCSDANGCPLALMRLQSIDRALAAQPDLAGRVRLVTASFDPKRDTPERMAELRGHMAPQTDWRFLTAARRSDLAPVLREFGQDVAKVIGEDGKETAALRHVLKVFLVDAQGHVRNIYAGALLDPRLVVADIRTLLGSAQSAQPSAQSAQR